MSLEVINKATKEIEEARKLLNSGEQVPRERLTTIREGLGKLRQEISKNRPDTTETTQQQELDLREKQIEEIDNQITAHMKVHEDAEAVSKAAQNPTEEALQKTEKQLADTMQRVPGPLREWIRNFFAGMGLTGLSDYLQRSTETANIRAALKQALQPQLAARVQDSPRDNHYTKQLQQGWRAKLRAERKNEDQYSFSQYYQEKIEEFAKNENERLVQDPNYRPLRITVGSLTSLVPFTAARNRPGQNQAPDLSLKQREELNYNRPLLQVRHARQIARTFNAVLNGGVINVEDLPTIPPNTSRQDRENILKAYQDRMGDRVIAALSDPANKTKAYLMINRGETTLREYEGLWFSGNDAIMLGFGTKIKENPIHLYRDLLSLDPSRISGLGSSARNSIDAIKSSLASESGPSGVDHTRGLQTLDPSLLQQNAKAAENTKAQADKAEQAAKKTEAAQNQS